MRIRKIIMQQQISPILTPSQAAYILNIKLCTLYSLVHSGSIPHTYVREHDTQELRFNFYTITDWLQHNPMPEIRDSNSIDTLRSHIHKTFPTAISSLQALDSQFKEKRVPKGYSLKKIPNKKYGFLYYVRYVVKGKLVYSQWSTGTNNKTAADHFAIENREKILQEYYEKKLPQNIKENLYTVLNGYYKVNSEYFEEAKTRGRTITTRTQRVFNNWTRKVFVPFLRENRVLDFDGITPPLISKLQTQLLKKGNKPQTINQYMGGINAVLNHMVLNGVITENVLNKVAPLKENKKSKESKKIRGCYEIPIINGVFNSKWREELEYFLNLIIYTTNMRNSEIEKIQPVDIIKIKDCYFIDIPESKTENGVRCVPLHPFVYGKIMSYIKKYNIPSDGYLFSPNGKPNQSYVYDSAKIVLGEKLHKRLGIKKEDVETYLKKENITFYSGRPFWKTLMNENNLGDIEEYFMGHKVTQDVEDLYTRKDKVGQEIKLKKVRMVYKILDKWVFKG